MKNVKQLSSGYVLKDTNKNGKPYVYFWMTDTEKTNSRRAKKKETMLAEGRTKEEIHEALFVKGGTFKRWVYVGKYEPKVGLLQDEKLYERLAGLSVEERNAEMDNIRRTIEEKKEELDKKVMSMRKEAIEKMIEKHEEELKKEADTLGVHFGHYLDSLHEYMMIGMTIKKAMREIRNR